MSRLVAQRYTQVEELDIDEIFAPVTRLNATASVHSLCQEVHIATDGCEECISKRYTIEKAYVEQPKEFVNLEHPDYV